MAKKGGNPQNFNNPVKESLDPITIRLKDKQVDEFLRSLSNRNKWIQEAIAEKYAREQRLPQKQSA